MSQGVCLKFQGYFKEVSSVFQVSFREISRVFKESFMGVSTKIEGHSMLLLLLSQAKVKTTPSPRPKTGVQQNSLLEEICHVFLRIK